MLSNPGDCDTNQIPMAKGSIVGIENFNCEVLPVGTAEGPNPSRSSPIPSGASHSGDCRLEADCGILWNHLESKP